MARNLVLKLIFLGVSLLGAWGSNENPRLYVQTQCIEHVNPVRKGFIVRIPEPLMETQLRPKMMPTVYYAAVSVNPDKTSFRDMTVDEKIMNNLQIHNLDLESWYYVCVEFENQDRTVRKGNFSTSCTLQRTLDKYGKGADSTVTEVRQAGESNNELRFDLTLQVDFPMQYDIYLEGGPRVQSYIIQKNQVLKVLFSDLVRDFSYGKLCVIEKPLVHGYTCMGRSIDAKIQKCHFDNLRTTNVHELASVQQEFRKSRRSMENSNSNAEDSETSGSPVLAPLLVLLLVSLCL